MLPINRYLDAAILQPQTTESEAIEAIKACIALETITVCVRPCDIKLAQSLCKETQTGVCVVLGFPHGCQLSDSKADEARRYSELGVNEIDMVVNYGYAKSGLWDAVREDITKVVAASTVPVKVIFESAMLDIPTVQKLVEICIEAGADFVKTSTGFNGGGASEDVVQAMLQTAAGRIKVKPSGGIRDRETAQKYVDMGVHRLGVGWTSCEAICNGQASSSNTTGY